MARQRAFTALHRAIFHHIRHLDLYFFLAGLYEKHTLVFKTKLPSVILNTFIVNSLIAALFFYLVPSFGIAPKTNLLFIFLFPSP